MNLQTLKNNYAKEQGYSDWHELANSVQDDLEYEQHWTKICILAQKAALEKAAEYFDMHWNKASITNPENLIR